MFSTVDNIPILDFSTKLLNLKGGGSSSGSGFGK
jgi:hypothetical protein